MHFLRYDLLEQIGAGGQGVVWSALEKENKRIVAIKFIDTSGRQAQAVSDKVFEQQGQLFSRLEHPNVLPLYDYGSLPDFRYLVSLYIPGGTLQEKLAGGMLPTRTALEFAAHVASALDYLHSHEIIHRDLKPGNVLMDFMPNIYVFDFGLARVLSDSTMAMHTGHGTLPYSPPEQSSHAEITVQSDIYSFGVMLYQFFTGHIPWDGETALGIQQLHSNEELPDPREYNPELPPGLAGCLRRITAAVPAARPGSASEAMQMLYDSFNVAPIPVDITLKNDTSPIGLGTNEIVRAAMAGWEVSSPDVSLTLTKFALVDQGQKSTGSLEEPGNLDSFMLHCALAYGYDVDSWWKKVENPQQRLEIAATFIRRDNLQTASRVLGYLMHDRGMNNSKAVLPETLLVSMLDIAGSKVSLDLKQNIFNFLEQMISPLDEWQSAFPGTKAVQALAALASQGGAAGDRAARLIGLLHSENGVKLLLIMANDDRRNQALLRVLEAAGSLPSAVPRGMTWSLSIERLAAWTVSNLASLLGIYGLAALGVFLGFGTQVYLTYRLPNFMDMTRISIAVERGLFMGFIFGFGIFITRLLSEIIPAPKPLLRMVTGTLVGGTLLTAGLWVYDILFLNTLPEGIMFAAGCFFISGGYALSQWMRPVSLKIIIPSLVIFLALSGTWFGHLATATFPTRMTPMFFYDYAWSGAQILGTMLAVTLPMAVFGSLGKMPGRQTRHSHL